MKPIMKSDFPFSKYPYEQISLCHLKQSTIYKINSAEETVTI